MKGRFIAIVGPSGVGKDSVMSMLAAAESRVTLARRVITRPANAGGENFDGIEIETFNALVEAGHFSLWWSAHGLKYGIPASVEEVLHQGGDILANLSRTVLQEAAHRFEHFQVIVLTAQPEMLIDRLGAGGRENSDEIAHRMQRIPCDIPPEINAVTLDNSGPLMKTVTQLRTLLYPDKEKR